MKRTQTRPLETLLAILLIALVSATGTARGEPVCRRTLPSSPGPVICTRFYSTAGNAAIRVPDDTFSVKYGTVNPRTLKLTTRTGRAYRVGTSVNSTDFDSAAVYQTIYRAYLGRGSVYKLEPSVFVEEAAMLRVFAGVGFAGATRVLAGPAKVPASNWMLLGFRNTVSLVRENNQTAGVLEGNFVNWNQSVRWNAACRAAFISNPTEEEFYGRVFGTERKVTLSWFPAMHNPHDSQLVLTFNQLGGGYMTPLPALHTLLSGVVRPLRTRKWLFTVHGNPMGSVSQIEGRFWRRNWEGC